MGSPTCQQMGAGDDSVRVQAPLGSQEALPCFLLPLSPSRLGRAGSSVTGGSRGSGQERCSRSGDLPFSGVFGHLVCVPKVQKASSREAVRPGDWGASLDLTDAYFQIPFAKADRKWLRFVWEDQKFQFRALPFGLSLAPWYSP